MSDLMRQEQLERRLRAELEESERQLREATLEELAGARHRYRQALGAFSRLVVDGVLP